MAGIYRERDWGEKRVRRREKSLCVERGTEADLKLCPVSDSLNKRDGVGRYSEMLPKSSAHLLNPLLDHRPGSSRSCRVPDSAPLFGQNTKSNPRLIRFPVSAIGKAKFGIIEGLSGSALQNLHSLVTQERDFDSIPGCCFRPTGFQCCDRQDRGS